MEEAGKKWKKGRWIPQEPLEHRCAIARTSLKNCSVVIFALSCLRDGRNNYAGFDN
ncbi:hypothetical protein KIN20_007045 [Parelaphostrongylus tenuis]|uniref:Uncharacterized protein n=1 Tax=Parelaphostrongylus tenuis TaxID=148309 RepID=A0AAD5MP07_PARTN|nr:hypothetical protein KIN20_007045 [Parelaphostrongylus tenuis]